METTIFDDAVNFNVKHPLNTDWVLWFDNPNHKRPQANHWEANLKEIIKIDSVEDFWGVHANTVPPVAIPLGANYHFFRSGIMPAWEDPKNAGGGKWTFSIKKDKRAEMYNDAWLNTIMSCIGEFSEFSLDICGAVCSSRKHADRISIWLSTGDKEKCESIGRHFKEACGFGDDETFDYEMHPKDPNAKPRKMYSV